MGERGLSPYPEEMRPRSNSWKEKATIAALVASSFMGGGEVKPQHEHKSSYQKTEVLETKPEAEKSKEELLRLLFREVDEPKNLELQKLIKDEREKLARDFAQRMRDAAPYLLHAMKIFQEEGVPAQFALLALPESGFKLSATSPSQAHGPFQFTEATARSYGLEINGEIDERRDPFLASRAAACLLRDLYQRTGSWEKSILAYNSGMALRYQGSWEEYIEYVSDEQHSKHRLTRRSARESLRYLPRFFATRQLFQEYLLDNTSWPSAVAITQLELNFPETRPEQIYQVKSGDNLSKIATHLQVTVPKLCQWNKIKKKGIIKPGQKIKYFQGPSSTPTAEELARQFNLTLSQIQENNSSWKEPLFQKQKKLPNQIVLNLPHESYLNSKGLPDQIVTVTKSRDYSFASNNIWESFSRIIETKSPQKTKGT